MAFWPGQRTCGDDKVFAVGTNAKKVASRALGGIFSGGWASKMEIPDKSEIPDKNPSRSRLKLLWSTIG
jgi:hypothetical protein